MLFIPTHAAFWITSHKQQMFAEYLIIPTMCRIALEDSKEYSGNNLSTAVSALKTLELRIPE